MTVSIYHCNENSRLSASDDNTPKMKSRQARIKTSLLAGLLVMFLLFSLPTPVHAVERVPSERFDTAPFAFSKLDPQGSDQPTSLSLEWENSKFANYYEYCLDTSLNNTCDGDNWISTGTDTQKDLTGLAYSTTFEWQVRATNSKGTTVADSGTWWQFTIIASPPGDFDKLGPLDDAIGQPISSLTLTWGSSSGVGHYEYCYDSTVDSTCTGSWTSNGTSTSAVLSGLSYSTSFEWQVRAINNNPLVTYANAGETPEWWHFTTLVASPVAFSKSGPTTGATGQPINLSLSWGASSNATGYEVCYDTTVNSTCELAGGWASTELLYANITGLDYADQYEWQVRAVNANPIKTDANDGETPEWWTFTTKDNPSGLYKISPGDGATNQSAVDLTLEWSSYGGTTYYEYCVDPVGGSDTPNSCDSGWINNGTDTIDTIDLTADTEYEWQVIAHDSTPTEADGGDWFNFTTVEDVPGDFNKLSPEDGANNQTLSLTLAWEESSGASSYKYCIDDLYNATCDTSWISVTDPIIDGTVTVAISGLTYDTPYYWQVRAYNANPNFKSADTELGGIWYSFTTIVVPPGSFSKTGPANDDIDQPLDLTLSWNSSGGAVSYEYCYDATIDQTCGNNNNGTWTSTGAARSASPTGLTYGVEYEWQVRAKNANPNPTYANSNTWWTFTSVVAPPGGFIKLNPSHAATNLLPSSVSLIWEPSDRAASYWYCVDSTINATCNGSWVYNNTSTTAIPTDLQFNTTYEWQIRADNANPVKTYANVNIWWQFTTRMGTLPGGFSKHFPLDIAYDRPTNPTLEWLPSSFATRYEYCYYDTAVASSCTAWINNNAALQVSLAGLELDHTYAWQVRAWNDTIGPTYANSGNYWTFTTVTIEPPEPFGKISPANTASNLLPSLITLAWQASTHADIYEFCIDDDPDGSCSSEWESTNATSVGISLDYGNTYEWQVRAFRDDNPNPTPANAGESPEWWTFSTTDAQPGAFNKSEPVNNASSRPTALSLSWGFSSGVNVLYEYCYEMYDGNDTCQGSWLTTTNNYVAISGLSNATTYSWQVRAVNANPTKTYADGGTWYQFTTIVAPPGNFAKLSPINSETSLPLSISLTWNPSSGATSYAYCYDSNVDGSCTAWIATTATSATLSGLAYNTSYEWQVRATNLGGTVLANAGSLWTFTSMATPPADFSKTSPARWLTNQEIDLALTWGASPGATYEYCIETTLNSVCDGAWTPTTELFINLSGLEYLTTYQWQVRAVNSNPNPTHANSGTWWMFTTRISPPAPFDKISPEDTVPNQPSSQYLTWQPSNGATGYEYCLDPDPTPDSICDATWKPTSLLYANESGLDYDATYEWQVRAIGTGTTYANADDWWTFEVKAMPAFSKANPNIGAINQPIEMELTWTLESSAISYEYCLDSDLSTGHVGVCDAPDWISTSGETSSELLTDFSYSTTYEWQVRAVISLSPLTYVYANAGETPEWWTFTTVEASPDAFSKSSPDDLSVDPLAIQPTIGLTLDWEPSAGATGYRYCLDTSTNESCNTSWVTVGAGITSVVISNLEYNKTYQWQVLASNKNPDMTNADDSESPKWWTFSTAKAPPEAFDKLSPETNALDQVLDLEQSWEATIGAEYYEYCIDTSLNATCDGDAWISTGTLTSFNPPGLVNATSYQWQVRAFSTNPYEPTLANGGTWFTFSTVVASPQAFIKNSPDSGLTNQPVNLMLSWEPSAGATGYEYCVDSDLVHEGCDGEWIETTSTQAIVSNLTNRTDYEWQVRAVNANPVLIESDSGEWFTFSTIPLHQFLTAVMSPQFTAPVLKPVTIGPAVNTYTLNWDAVTGTTTYKIWESLTTTFPVDPSYQTSATSFTLPQARNPTRYYYYMTAESSIKVSPPSNILTVNRQYELEDNDSSTAADGQIFTGVTYYGQIDDLRDYYKIRLDSPGTITVTMTSIPNAWPGQLQLFEEDTGNIRASDVTPGNGMLVTWAGEEANWYYILIATPPSGYSSNWYAFRVTITH